MDFWRRRATHIEGTHLTLDQSEKLLAGERPAGVDPEDAQELLNYRDAFEPVADYLGSGAPITESLIREIHKRFASECPRGFGHTGRIPASAKLYR